VTAAIASPAIEGAYGIATKEFAMETVGFLALGLSGIIIIVFGVLHAKQFTTIELSIDLIRLFSMRLRGHATRKRR